MSQFQKSLIFLTTLLSCVACNRSADQSPQDNTPQTYNLSNGTPTESIDLKLAESIAQKICQLSDGPFPNWPRVDEFKQWLTTSEVAAVHRVERAFRKHISQQQMPIYEATSRFIAQNTTCDLKFKENDDFNNIQYTFLQKTPFVPTATPQSTSHSTYNADDYLAAYNAAWKGEARSRIVNIVLFKEGSHWKLSSNVEKNFADPLDEKEAISTFTTALDHGELDVAQWILLSLCAQDKKACSSYNDLYDAASKQFSVNAAFAQQYLVIDNLKLTAIVQNSILPYTAAKLSITNNSDKSISNITMKSTEPEPQYCVLQATRQKRGDDPITIPPHQSVTAYCALSAQTKPFAQLEWLDFLIQ